MESCNNKYIIDRNNNVHFYTIITRLCYNSNNGYNHQWKCYTNIHTGRTAVPERNSTSTSNNIKQ